MSGTRANTAASPSYSILDPERHFDAAMHYAGAPAGFSAVTAVLWWCFFAAHDYWRNM
jgi:hypothetical protein